MKIAELSNYLGTGENPRLKLTLGTNGPGWNPYTIDYGSKGRVPYSDDEKKDWSTWNVKDENGKYYGMITLHSDGKTIKWGRYTPGEEGYYLEGIELSSQPFRLTAKRIHRPSPGGPFPDAPLAKPACYAGTEKPITLKVENSKIVDDYGREIILKGIVRPSLEWNPQGQYLSVADIRNMTTWNGNVLRLDLNQNYWFNSEPASKKGSYKQIINAMVHYATENKMAIILDLHWVENGRQSPMANKKSIQFWKEVAWDYKDFGTVIFELYNEPEQIHPNVWLNGDKDYAGYQELYEAVKSTGAKNICIANGTYWGYNLKFLNENFKLEGENIVYGSHPYDHEGKWDFDENFKFVLGKYPIILTEFGANEPHHYGNDNKYVPVYEKILGYAHRHSFNYTAFAWWVEPQKPHFPCLISDWNGTPLNGGKLIHEDMKKNPAIRFFNPPSLKVQLEPAQKTVLAHMRQIAASKAKALNNPQFFSGTKNKAEIIAYASLGNTIIKLEKGETISKEESEKLLAFQSELGKDFPEKLALIQTYVEVMVKSLQEEKADKKEILKYVGVVDTILKMRENKNGVSDEEYKQLSAVWEEFEKKFVALSEAYVELPIGKNAIIIKK